MRLGITQGYRLIMLQCRSYEKCGACTLLRTAYEDQLRIKREAVQKAFSDAGLDIRVREVEGMEDPFHYRNKVIAYVSMKDGKTICGFYEENSHKVIPAPDCMLHDHTLNEVLRSIREELDALKIKAYGFGGVLKNILLRIGVSTGQVMVVFVTSGEMFHGRKDLIKRLVARHPQIKTVIQNINPRETSVVLGEKEMVLHGSGYILDRLLGNSFKISAKSFYQVNPVQTAVLYTKAIGLAGIGPKDNVMDAYCGIGTIGLTAAPSSGWVLGVEINGDAVRDAIGNARANGLKNVRFFCDDVKSFMEGFDEPTDVLFIDPPRSGCDAGFIRAVRRLAPRRLVYISCNPVTQARDIAMLKGMYGISDAYPVDMFPHTSHIENIVLLTLKQQFIKI